MIPGSVGEVCAGAFLFLPFPRNTSDAEGIGYDKRYDCFVPFCRFRLAAVDASFALLPARFGTRQFANRVARRGDRRAVGAASGDPSVPRPATRPLAVPLFHDLTFTDYSSHPFAFVPPPGGKRRWAKIVLVGDFYVTAGRQYDRTGEISVGHTPIFFGTTAEPSDGVSPAWHVERDVTDYAALFAKPQPGQAQIGNTVNATYTGVIHGSAILLFYPVGKNQTAPPTPDLVLPLPAGGTGGKGIGSPAETLTETYTLPTNVTRAYLDVITQSQGSDEFWYLSVPNSLRGKLQSSGNTAFREAEITVDGVPAGVAPIFPWIYTGGIDPGWWRPIPAVQTLNLMPYRVDLTPFAGLFSNGKPHTVGVRVYNNAGFFQVAGALLVYRDPVLQTVRGGLLRNTLTADPSPIIQAPLTEAGGVLRGPVSVTSHRSFTIAGYVLTSAGKVETTLTQTADFSSVQQFDVGAKQDIQDVRQVSALTSFVQTQTPKSVIIQQDQFTYPLALTTRRRTNPDGTATQTASVEQGCRVRHETRRNGRRIAFQRISDIVHPSSARVFDVSGKPIKRSRQSTQTYAETGPHGSYTLTLTAENGVLTRVQDSRRQQIPLSLSRQSGRA